MFYLHVLKKQLVRIEQWNNSSAPKLNVPGYLDFDQTLTVKQTGESTRDEFAQLFSFSSQIPGIDILIKSKHVVLTIAYFTGE